MKVPQISGDIPIGSYRLDLVNQCLWRESKAIPLTPKAFAVLRCLAERVGTLVTKQELFDQVWPDTHVGDAVLKVCIAEIRKALRDRPARPRFIKTLHRRGYQLIGRAEPSRATAPVASPFGREEIFESLGQFLEIARGGRSQVVFLTGEAGIGKSTVAEEFLRRVARAGEVLTARGQCLQLFGESEPFFPVLEALNRLSRGPEGESVLSVLSLQAPTWLAQMPWLIPAEDRAGLQKEVLGATRERMLRELGEALEALTSSVSLVLLLENLHWSDYSTLDLISALARRDGTARLLILGTFRPLEALVQEHPLRTILQELRMHRRCEEVPLPFLAEKAIGHYLTARFAGPRFPKQLVRAIHRRTGGNPLFLVNMMDDLVERGLLAESREEWRLKAGWEKIVPHTVRRLIEEHFERLSSEERRVLEAACVAGLSAGEEFVAPVLAAALEEDPVSVEECCHALSRRKIFLMPGDGSGGWRFIQALYPEVLYERLASGRRILLHRRIAEHQAAWYGERAAEHAAVLALHFERGQDYGKAIDWLLHAAVMASRRCAHREATVSLERAIELCEHLPGPEQTQKRFEALKQLGLVHRAAGDMAAATRAFDQLLNLARETGDPAAEAQALIYRISSCSWLGWEITVQAAEQLRHFADRLGDSPLRTQMLGYCAYWRLVLFGWQPEDAQAAEEAEAAIRRGDAGPIRLDLGRRSFFLRILSEYREADRLATEALKDAAAQGDGFEYLLAIFFRNWALIPWGEWRTLLRSLREGLRIADKNGHRFWSLQMRLQSTFLLFWANDFERAYRVAEQCLKESDEIQHPFGQLVGHMMMGGAFLGMRQYDRASDCIRRTAEILERKRTFLGWMVAIPIHFGMADIYLARGEMDQAQRESQWICEAATRPRDRTWLALGRMISVQIALSRNDMELAQSELSSAHEALEDGEAPVAAWRVYAGTAELNRRLGRQEEAQRWWSKSAAIIQRLAENLEEDPDLRRTFLESDSVRTVLKEHPLAAVGGLALSNGAEFRN